MIWVGDSDHGRMIAHGASVGFDPDVDICLSRVDENGDFTGGFILTNSNGAACWVHAFGVGHWNTPYLMWALFDLCFNALGHKKLLATVHGNNKRMLDMVEHAGYEIEHRIAGAAAGGADLVLLSMVPEKCRWLKLGERYRKVEHV